MAWGESRYGRLAGRDVYPTVFAIDLARPGESFMPACAAASQAPFP